MPRATRVDSLDESHAVLLEGEPFFAVSVPSPGGPREGGLVVLYPEVSFAPGGGEAVLPTLLLGLGSLGVMVFVTSWIAHRISGRILRVERRVARVADGDFQELELGARQDEIADLMTSINRMCSQLRGMRQTIQQSEHLLAQLAAGLAHQIRNSLAGARMSVQLHVKHHPAPAGDEALAVALRQLALTEEQVKGLLSVGRVERRPPEVCELGRILEDVALLVDPACRHAKVALCQRPGDGEGDESLTLLADPSSLRAAILNLTLNAIEAAGEGEPCNWRLVAGAIWPPST